MKILVVGTGSIGSRYCKLIRELGHDLITYDELDDISMFRNLSEDLDVRKPNAVIISTPTKHHIEQGLECIKHSIPVLIEKPLSYNMENINYLDNLANMKDIFIGVVHNLRYNPGLKKINNEYIDQIGDIQYIHSVAASYLPEWKPGTDYKVSYSADKESGGAILDFIHELDYVMWFLNDSKVTDTKCTKMYDLFKNGPESGALITLDFEGFFKSNIYINFAQKIPERHCHIVGDEGVIDWDYYDNVVTIQKTNGIIDKFRYSCERNDMYREMLKDFIENSTQGYSHEFKRDLDVLKVAIDLRK